MGSKSKRGSTGEAARQMLARERDAAIERTNQVIAQAKIMVEQNNRMQQDMVRWVVAFMLLHNVREVSVDKGTLMKTADFVLERHNDVAADTVVWSLLSREEAEARKAAAEAAAADEPPPAD